MGIDSSYPYKIKKSRKILDNASTIVRSRKKAALFKRLFELFILPTLKLPQEAFKTGSLKTYCVQLHNTCFDQAAIQLSMLPTLEPLKQISKCRTRPDCDCGVFKPYKKPPHVPGAITLTFFLGGGGIAAEELQFADEYGAPWVYIPCPHVVCHLWRAQPQQLHESGLSTAGKALVLQLAAEASR
eukprot:1141307-Pelagomonas_calceolata.AAC.5